MQPEKAQSSTRIRFICRFGSIALGCAGLGLILPGCGNVLYTYRASSASSKLEEARQAGAEKSALYEYTLARAHLDKAMSEAAEADYGDAYELAELADGYAERAIAKAKYQMRQPHSPAPAVAASEGATDPNADTSTSPVAPESDANSDGQASGAVEQK